MQQLVPPLFKIVHFKARSDFLGFKVTFPWIPFKCFKLFLRPLLFFLSLAESVFVLLSLKPFSSLVHLVHKRGLIDFSFWAFVGFLLLQVVCLEALTIPSVGFLLLQSFYFIVLAANSTHCWWGTTIMVCCSPCWRSFIIPSIVSTDSSVVQTLFSVNQAGTTLL